MKSSTISRVTHNPFSENSIFENSHGNLSLSSKQNRVISDYITK